MLGLLGRTGSGKTTLARLVFRLYDPEPGRIVLGGVDTRQRQIQALRQRVAMVTQDVQLFQASVRDNLTFFDRSIADERILDVIEELELCDWYASLPDGLDTELETGGRGLSAGEAQLLAFTRVFLRDPGLVILDEASSRLDPATEQLIERAVDRLLREPHGDHHRAPAGHRAARRRDHDPGRWPGGRVRERERLAADPALASTACCRPAWRRCWHDEHTGRQRRRQAADRSTSSPQRAGLGVILRMVRYRPGLWLVNLAPCSADRPFGSARLL